MGKKEGEKGKEDGWQREGWREARGRGAGLVNRKWTESEVFCK